MARVRMASVHAQSRVAMEQTVRNFLDARNTQDAHLWAMTFTKDADLRSLARARAPVLGTRFPNSRPTAEIRRMRFLTLRLAARDAHGQMTGARWPKGSARPQRNGLRKRADGWWRMASLRNSEPIDAPEETQ